jgi:tRNA A37 threonylcarbamoyladenosine synthetase subunit TsaC/SUA5/YrdC
MTLPKQTSKNIVENSWNDIAAIKNAMNDNPASVHPDKMEQLTEYLVATMKKMGG